MTYVNTGDTLLGRQLRLFSILTDLLVSTLALLSAVMHPRKVNVESQTPHWSRALLAWWRMAGSCPTLRRGLARAAAEFCTEPGSDGHGLIAVLRRRRWRRIIQGDARIVQGWIHGRKNRKKMLCL